MKQTQTDGSATISTTEYSLPAATTSGVPTAQTDDSQLQAIVDLANMVAGDQYQIRVYEKVNAGTARVLFEAYPTGAQPGPFVSPVLCVGDGWDVTVKRLAGSDRSITWSLRKYVEGESVVVASGGIVAASIASDAITAAKIADGAIDAATFAAGAINAAAIAADAITAAKVAADVTTEITSGLATATNVSAVTTAISALLPSALVGGKIDAHVNDIAASAITAASIASDAITAAKIATAAITAAKFAAGAIDAAAIATDAIDADALKTDAVTEIQNGLATSTALAAVQADTDDIQTRLPAALDGGFIKAQVKGMDAGTVTAAVVATDAIDSDAIAASAVTELQSGLATSSALSTVNTNVGTAISGIAAVQADTDDIQGRIPAALVSGRIDATVGAMQANVMTAAAAAADLTTEITAAVGLSTQVDSLEGSMVTVMADLDDIQTRLPAALVSGRIDASVGAMAAGVLTAAAIAADAIAASKLAADVGTEIAAAVWGYAHETARTAKGVLVRLDAFMTGKATGLLGVLAAFYRADGTTKAIEATQDPDLGTRTAASTVAGD